MSSNLDGDGMDSAKCPPKAEHPFTRREKALDDDEKTPLLGMTTQ